MTSDEEKAFEDALDDSDWHVPPLPALRKHAQCASEVCQMATLLIREAISHTDAANWIIDLAERTCDDTHATDSPSEGSK